VGYQLVRLRFDDGRPAAFEDFVTGFLTEGARRSSAACRA
jgi:hypothetical protein